MISFEFLIESVPEHMLFFRRRLPALICHWVNFRSIRKIPKRPNMDPRRPSSGRARTLRPGLKYMQDLHSGRKLWAACAQWGGSHKEVIRVYFRISLFCSTRKLSCGVWFRQFEYQSIWNCTYFFNIVCLLYVVNFNRR